MGVFLDAGLNFQSSFSVATDDAPGTFFFLQDLEEQDFLLLYRFILSLCKNLCAGPILIWYFYSICIYFFRVYRSELAGFFN